MLRCSPAWRAWHLGLFDGRALLDESAACPANAVVNCEQVLSSRYAVIGGSPCQHRPPGSCGSRSAPAWPCCAAASAPRLGVHRLVSALFLVYVEIVQLGAVCIWCTAAHAMVLLIFLIALMQRDLDRWV